MACGLCCDGTLIGFVQLEREELPALRDVLAIEEANGDGFFLQPCINYCDGCGIYSQRPKQCGLYKCGLLKSVEQREIEFDSAVETIHAVKQKKAAIEEKLALLQLTLQSKSFYFKMVELNTWLQKNKSEPSFMQLHMDLMSDIKQLDSLLSERFDAAMF